MTTAWTAVLARPFLLLDERLPVPDPLAEWRWMIGPEATIVALTRAGDAIIGLPDTTVGHLDTGSGVLERIAPTRSALDQLMSNPLEADRLLLAAVVEESVRVQGAFPAGVCLGFTQLPILGGAYGISNRFRLDAVEHFGVTGELHRQLRALPDGTPVRVEAIE